MLVDLQVHPSQFPDSVQASLRDSLRSRQINPNFHYESYKQSRKWVRVHRAYAPPWRDGVGGDAYEAAFAAAVQRLRTDPLHLVALGCGGGDKEARLLRLCRARTERLVYSPIDVSLALILLAHQAALPLVDRSYPLVCDLRAAPDLGDILARQTPAGAIRLVTFFGMLPNFEPGVALSLVQPLLRPGDLLLLSANLAPGADYAAGIDSVLPQYANALTADWLLTFLADLGVEREDGGLEWSVEPSDSCLDLRCIAAWFQFRRARSLEVGEEAFLFAPGDRLRLFYSYRYTPDRVGGLLSRHGLRMLGQWVFASDEEGLFLGQPDRGNP